MHGFGGFWGMIAVGLFAREDKIVGGFSQYEGFVWNGETYLLGITRSITLNNLGHVLHLCFIILD